jgi:hypothetical protein
MRNIIFALVFGFSTAALAQAGQPVELAPDAPDHHTVVKGDTLWGIAAKFLKDPFRWPEIWKMNAEEVRNPHRIYPGQVVILDRSEMRLRLGQVVKLSPQVHAEVPPQEIPSIPAQAIEPFLAQPLVIEPHNLDGAPRIVALQENRVFGGNGDLVYASGVNPKVGHWQVYKPGKPLVDPDSGEALGIEAIFLGNARVSGATSQDVTPLTITSARQEIGRGDQLVPASRPEIMSYMPHPPARPVEGRVLKLYDGVGIGGRNSIVAISRGSKDGLEMGHVLALYSAGSTVTNRFGDTPPQTHALPEERYGLMFVFRVFERVSYALVTAASRPVAAGDRIRQP